MTIEAKIVCDSVGPNGVRLTTFVLKYPRMVHSEFLVHRDFSRNASSSRAIPVKKQIEMVMADPVVPLVFTKNQKGMQGGEALDGKVAELAKDAWIQACLHACDKAKMLSDLEVHKQYANRILEPFSHITVVVSATRWANFFALRHHSAAQPEIAELAIQMFSAYLAGQPKELSDGEWHLPFVSEEEIVATRDYRQTMTETSTSVNWPRLLKLSVARCARVSYLNHEGKNPSEEEDFRLYDRLLGGHPIHASPAEHQGQAVTFSNQCLGLNGNFHGWIQYRKTLENEYITEFKEPLG